MRRNYKKAEQLLASEDPLWFCLVDLNKLDMSDGACCVFGQVEHALHPMSLWRDIGAFSRLSNRYGLSPEEEIRVGVNAGWLEEGAGGYLDLEAPQRRWRRRIKELQAAHNCAEKESAVPAGGTADREEE